MAFADPTAISPDAPTVVTTNQLSYAIQENGPGKKTVRGVAGLDPDVPFLLTISHETNKDGVIRHLVRFDDTFQDAVDPTLIAPVTAYVVISVPPVVGTVANSKAAVRKICNFLTDANLTKLLNSES